MRLIRLAGEIDFTGWRHAARRLVDEGVPPQEIEWTAGDAASLLANDSIDAAAAPSPQFKVPRAFMTLAQSAILHSDPARFAVLYRLLWRLREEPRLLSVASDADVARVLAMSQAVGREIHKTHAFVRFREVGSETGAVFIAWFEPTHHTLEAAAPFFVRRFAAMRWSILTPRVSAHWNGLELEFGPGAAATEAPRGDALEQLWRTYYASIFNPARLKIHTMQAQMPRKYWRNMPEAELIGELIARAPEATQTMIESAPTAPRLRAPAREALPRAPGGGLDALRIDAQRCTACPLYAKATQTVFGEGPAPATIMFVGEQPGDQEDLVGRPFVGPAGQLFDRALADAGLVRTDTYVTNAVKHFKFEPRGKRRLHKTPGQLEMEACRPWLEHEISLVRPRLIVALGATAAHSLLRRPTPVQRNRGRLIPFAGDVQLLLTVHPSYLLRVPEAQQPDEYRRFIADLRLTLPFVVRAATPA